jgi:myo-inositol 2-dehydrogenase / D-chiro-inositol 1-dehydrogenase
MEMKRIGVIGYGRRLDVVIKNVVGQSNGQVEVVAFHDSSEKAVQRVTAENPTIRCCSTVAELVTAPDIDWVFIGSFNAAHSGHAVAALDAGKDVFCEKPVATTRQQCMDIVAARKRNPDKQFVVGFVLRYSSFYRTMKKWIDGGSIGQVDQHGIQRDAGPASWCRDAW